MNRTAPRRAAGATDGLYDRDFHAWTRHAARLLRAGRLADADLDHAAREIEDMGKRDANELDSRMQVLVAHLLKWQVERAKRSRSWTRTIGTQRLEIGILLRRSPSLRAGLAADLGENFAGAVKRAALDSGLGRERFPRSCPYSVARILDEDFLPD